MKIKFLVKTKNKVTNAPINIDDVLDLGKERNENAVKNGYAEWVEDTENNEKQEVKKTRSRRKKVVKGDEIETK